ncbi:MAG: hypothetical protein DLM69_01705 [Candidatus Chloroheliales bacterium]|nr:MAG: hypothetical protein DLM69_01705 [Chloroflexota bacterium]
MSNVQLQTNQVGRAQINREMDEFTTKLIEALLGLHLLDPKLNAAPAEIEKYPRQLLNLIEARAIGKKGEEAAAEVEAAYQVWASFILRKKDTQFSRRDNQPRLEMLHKWMTEHSAMLADRRNLRDLRQSMFGRIFNYLYHRMAMIEEYIASCRNRGLKEIDEADVNKRFDRDTIANYKRLAELVNPEEANRARADAKAMLLDRRAWFGGRLKRKTDSDAESSHAPDMDAEEYEQVSPA